MNEKNLPSYNFTIYLIKDSPLFKTLESVINPSNLEGYTLQPLSGNSAVGSDTEEYHRLYTKNDPIGPPDWANLFGVDINRWNASGLFLRKVNGRIFALAFGSSGRFLIKETAIVRRFGLMVVLNSVEPESLRSVDKIVLSESGLQSRTQSSQPSDGTAFGIDIQQDLVKNVSGKAKNDKLYGSTITGKDSLNVTIKVDLETLDTHLEEYLRAYQDKEYKKFFSFIDNINPCDSTQSEKLDQELVKKLNDGSLKKVWLTIPDIIDWADHKGFVYSHSRKQQVEVGDDVSLGSFREGLDDEEIDIELLHTREVIRITADGKKAKEKWSIYRCIYAELTVGTSTKKQYILSEGEWYEVKSDFRDEVEAKYSSVPKECDGLDLVEYEGDEKEETYNTRLASSINGYKFDKKKITITGRSPFEFCDVLTRQNKLVHVKRYSGSSALSHLFNQGYVSANLMLEPEIRNRINAADVDGFRFSNPEEDIETSNYEIVYGIISRVDNDLDIPFFSKIMLVRAAQDLKKLGFSASLIKIKHKASVTPKKVDDE